MSESRAQRTSDDTPTVTTERKVKWFVEPTAKLPTRGTSGAAAYDLYANLPNGPVSVTAGQIGVMIPLGVYTELPPGWMGLICTRSGYAARGLFVVNAPGIVDEDYRGEWKIILGLLGGKPVTINHGDRVAQVLLQPAETLDFEVVDSREELSDTQRGTGGYGSTGR